MPLDIRKESIDVPLDIKEESKGQEAQKALTSEESKDVPLDIREESIDVSPCHQVGE